MADDPEERLILRSWYALGKSWGEIADQFEISQSKIFNKNCKHLNRIIKLFILKES